MSKPTIALVTAEAARDLDEDLPPLESALRNAGADVVIAEWDRPHDWSRFDIALLRSTWDYPQRLAEFFDWAAQVSTQTKLLNPLSVVKWSSDKHYLRDLVRAERADGADEVHRARRERAVADRGAARRAERE